MMLHKGVYPFLLVAIEEHRWQCVQHNDVSVPTLLLDSRNVFVADKWEGKRPTGGE